MNRSCGVLLPISSLPSEYGIGTLGDAAYKFVDFLKCAGQKYWQILPIVPAGAGDSPYSSCSTFAGNPYYIDLAYLIKCGLLRSEECKSISWSQSDDSVDYSILHKERIALLHKAYKRSNCASDMEFINFKVKNAYWLTDYSLFMTLKHQYGET